MPDLRGHRRAKWWGVDMTAVRRGKSPAFKPRNLARLRPSAQVPAEKDLTIEAAQNLLCFQIVIKNGNPRNRPRKAARPGMVGPFLARKLLIVMC